MKKQLCLILAALMLLSACGKTPEPAPTTAPTTAPLETTAPHVTTVPATAPPTSGLPLYSDIRYIAGFEGKEIYKEDEYDRDWIYTYYFNASTILEGAEDLQAQILEEGKNPGLGVRSLHAQGITGEGVNVAIIDQKLLLGHPEYAGKIAAYYEHDTIQPSAFGSMHGPAVTSLLVGETIGVAPGARVYYAAYVGTDSANYADCLRWIIEQNERLPEGEKIRVVSRSGAPSGENRDMWSDAVQAAKGAGILVIDCRAGEASGFVGPAYFDRLDRESPAKCTGGFLNQETVKMDQWIGAPISYRTVAEAYTDDSYSYQYDAVGGLSWAIPYVAGVLALGWQVNPELDSDGLVKLLYQTSVHGKNAWSIIDPVAFIAAVQETVK